MPIERPAKSCERHRVVTKNPGAIGPRRTTCYGTDCHNLLTLGRGPRKWCSETCRWTTLRQTKPEIYVDPQRARHHPRRPIDYATCIYCEQLFVVRRRATPLDRVCRARECRAQHNNERMRELRVVRKAAGRSMSTPAGLDRRRAANSERRAKTRGAGRIERFSPEEIFERDGWRCGVCGRKVSKKPWPHPKSPTLDHIVPLIEGGEHTRANSRCAHLSCNSSRGHRGGDEQLRLLG